ncbi:hypothetical protein NF681_07025 [Comamonadaceae bacterium OTU4NAUVB1]|nr:hypothetical protein NF681_07025 [Comamonadaceae bacterium OTU4NAUVB1]
MRTDEVDIMIWRRDLRAYFGGVSDETVRRWIRQGKLPKPDVDFSLRTRGWKLSTLQKAGINLVIRKPA